MAWNPSPEVAAARDFGGKFDAEKVVVVYVTAAGQLGYASWGKTRALCDQTKLLGDALYASAWEHLTGEPMEKE